MKRKIVPQRIIADCCDCISFDVPTFDRCGDSYCMRMHKNIKEDGIPDWCPLEDAKEDEDEH